MRALRATEKHVPPDEAALATGAVYPSLAPGLPGILPVPRVFA